MAFNGSGTFVRVHNWVDDDENGIDIEPDRHDEEDDGFATGLSNCITKNGETTITANLPMGGFRHTGVGIASARNHYGVVSQIQDQSYTYCGAAGGTANAITLSPSPVITTYAAGQAFEFLPPATNTSGTVTIATSALAVRAIKKSIGGALVILAPGDLILNVPARVLDDGTQYVLQNPATYSHGADIASASTVNLDTATGDLVDVTGTTTITAITLSEGREATVRFTGILTLTHGASLVLPGAANITTAAGDFAIFRGYASGVVRCVAYTRAAVAPLATITTPTFSVHRNNVNQASLGATAYTKIQFTTEEFDTNSNFDSATNYRFTPTVAGKYAVHLAIFFASGINSDVQVAAAIYKNGAIHRQGSGTTIATGGGAFVSAIVDMNGSSDYIEGFAYNGDATGRNLDGNMYNTFMTGVRVGP